MKPSNKNTVVDKKSQERILFPIKKDLRIGQLANNYKIKLEYSIVRMCC